MGKNQKEAKERARVKEKAKAKERGINQILNLDHFLNQSQRLSQNLNQNPKVQEAKERVMMMMKTLKFSQQINYPLLYHVLYQKDLKLMSLRVQLISLERARAKERVKEKAREKERAKMMGI